MSNDSPPGFDFNQRWVKALVLFIIGVLLGRLVRNERDRRDREQHYRQSIPQAPHPGNYYPAPRSSYQEF